MQVLGRFPLSVSFPPSHAGTKSKIFEESLLAFFNGSFQRHHFAVPIAVQQRRPEAKVARWQNLIPSFPWIVPHALHPQSKETKGSNFAIWQPWLQAAPASDGNESEGCMSRSATFCIAFLQAAPDL